MDWATVSQMTRVLAGKPNSIDDTAVAILRRNLSVDEVATIDGRISEWASVVGERDELEIVSMLSNYFMVFPSMRGSAAEAGNVVRAYLGELRDLPPWAVKSALSTHKETAKSPAFPPSAIELYQAAKKLTATFDEQLLLFRQIRNAVSHAEEHGAE